jgi:hypothetical protein
MQGDCKKSRVNTPKGNRDKVSIELQALHHSGVCKAMSSCESIPLSAVSVGFRDLDHQCSRSRNRVVVTEAVL